MNGLGAFAIGGIDCSALGVQPLGEAQVALAAGVVQQREAEWAALVDAADDQLQFVGEWMRDTVQRVKGQMEPGDSVTDSARGCPSWPAGSRGFEPACLLPKR